MAQNLVGIDVGRDNVKICCREHGTRFIVRRLPENIMGKDGLVSPRVMVEFLKRLRADEHIHTRDASIVLTEKSTFFRHVTLPAMTVSELKVNLPFEFHDFISENPDGYVFDYAVDEMVLNDAGEPERMELFAAATRKDSLQRYEEALRRAGFRVKVAVPAPMATMFLFRNGHEGEARPTGDGSVVIDIGYKNMVVSLYDGDRYRGSRRVESGCYDVDLAIAELKGVDPHVAGSYRDKDFDEVLESRECMAVFERLLFEVSKVVNFYTFSHPETTINNIYLAGGGACIDALVSLIASDFDTPVWLVNSLMSDDARTSREAVVCSLAYAGLIAGEANLNGD